jgi:hypothetical protein
MKTILTRHGAIALPCLLLAACATTTSASPPAPIERADAAIDRAQAAYDQAKLFADILLPLLPSQYQARVLAAEATANLAFAAARRAATMAEQLAALRRAETALGEIAAITGTR